MTSARPLPSSAPQRSLPSTRTVGEPATVHGRFLEVAAQQPQAVALVQDKVSLHFAELRIAALAFAGACVRAGVKGGTLVAVDARRSPETVIALLGIPLAGGVYVPVDLADCATAALLARHNIRFLASGGGAEATHEIGFPGVERLRPAIKPSANVRPFGLPGEDLTANDPLYVLFTSGSTGTPKGVIVPHRGVDRLVAPQRFRGPQGTGTPERMLLHSPLTFDASTLELWSPLLGGGTVVLAPDRPLGVRDFAELVGRHQVTALWLTAGLFHLVTRQAIETFAPLRTLLVGGDVVDAALFARVKQRFPALELVNGYGPTENTTFTTCYVAGKGFAEPTVPIGEPLNGTTVFLLDEHGVPVAEGEPGELATGGAGVALGYLDDPQLTRQRFRPDLTCADEAARIYLTGDLARRRLDGRYEFLGRKDGEVKLAGQRVQLEEVERAILASPAVRACAAVAAENEEAGKHLVAFVAWQAPPDGKPADAERALREWLGDRLGRTAVPRVIVAVEEMPLSGNGKTDRSLLRERYLAMPRSRDTRRASVGENWQDVVERIWCGLLHRDAVDPTANFFDLGGDSLALVRMQCELAAISDQAPTLVELFAHPTVESIAGFLRLETERAAAPGKPELSFAGGSQ